MTIAKLNGFANSDAKAKIAEEKVENCFYHTGNFDVENVRHIPEYREMDVDLILIDKVTGEKQTVEVKSDDFWRDNGNFAIESVSNTNTGSPGWGLFCKADYIAIYYPAVDKLFLLDGPRLVSWFTENQERYPEVTNGTERREGGVLYGSKFRKVKRSDVEREVGLVAEITVNEYLKAS